VVADTVRPSRAETITRQGLMATTLMTMKRRTDRCTEGSGSTSAAVFRRRASRVRGPSSRRRRSPLNRGPCERCRATPGAGCRGSSACPLSVGIVVGFRDDSVG
jgi:hypothetical protein